MPEGNFVKIVTNIYPPHGIKYEASQLGHGSYK